MLSTIKHAPKPTKPSGVPPQEVKALAVVLRDEFDAPFRFYDTATGGLMLVPGQEGLGDDRPAGARSGARAGRGRAAEGRPPAGRTLPLGFPLVGLGPGDLVALGVVPALARTRPEAVPGAGAAPANGADRSTTGWSGPAASATASGARSSTTASR